ncbi:hypothetical protein CCMA1212_001056 [Trichoderma ghanense]|uniref:Uncharacterized protein n=1 Tax=Trichoderma ghanense TaxID=65468 RepID=A0ABY2HEE1_9HYPO
MAREFANWSKSCMRCSCWRPAEFFFFFRLCHANPILLQCSEQPHRASGTAQRPLAGAPGTWLATATLGRVRMAAPAAPERLLPPL